MRKFEVMSTKDLASKLGLLMTSSKNQCNTTSGDLVKNDSGCDDSKTYSSTKELANRLGLLRSKTERNIVGSDEPKCKALPERTSEISVPDLKRSPNETEEERCVEKLTAIDKSTKQKALMLGLLRRSSSCLPKTIKNEPSHNSTKRHGPQIFNHVIVLDFESTCWKDRSFSTPPPEVIEFPAILVAVDTNEIKDKFQQYVKPTEHSILSEFCTQLTGITQDKVDSGISIASCLDLFSQWLNHHIADKCLCFPSLDSNAGSKGDSRAAFVTWSDWDLKTCLRDECQRKNITYSSHLQTWIDLRKTFRDFYKCSPKGLNGALQHLGLTFHGREHCGLDDAVNTGRLLLRMVLDGCVMQVTKSLVLPLSACNRI